MNSIIYKQTYNKLFTELPKWKQFAIIEDSKNNNWSGILTDFVKNVIYTAEIEFEHRQLLFTDEPVTYDTPQNKPKKSLETKVKTKRKKKSN